MIALLLLGVVLSIAFLAYFLYHPVKTSTLSTRKTNISLAKQQLEVLSNDVKNGLLSADNFAQAKQDIAQTLAQELAQEPAQDQVLPPIKNSHTHYILIFLLMFVATISLGTYQLVGQANIKDKLSGLEAVRNTADLENFVSRNPKYKEAIKMLAHVYFADGQLQKSKEFYEQAYQLDKQDIQTLVEYAVSLATLQNNSLAGQPAQLIKEALELDNNSMTALYLGGLVAYQQEQLPLAKKAWQRALKNAPAGSQDQQVIAKHLQDLAQEMGEKISSTPSKKEADQSGTKVADTKAWQTKSAGTKKKATATGTQERDTKPAGITKVNHRLIQASIALSPALKAQVSPSDFVLIYAKNTQGMPAPLAIVKKQVKDLPMRVQLSDKDAMLEGFNLSSARKIVVVARISKTGQAIRQPGDIEVISEVLDLTKTAQPQLELQLK